MTKKEVMGVVAVPAAHAALEEAQVIEVPVRYSKNARGLTFMTTYPSLLCEQHSRR